MAFKATHSLVERLAESTRIRAKYPDRIPVIIERVKNSTLEQIDRNKYLLPFGATCRQLLLVIRKLIPKLNPQSAIFIFVGNNTLLSPSETTIGEIYKMHKDSQDGFVYVQYDSEKTFG